MATEQAQRLIAMSLGKIAASRNQRGGANLHKSLLVSTVLHKARTTIMMESYQAMIQARRAQMEAQQRFVDSERPGTPAPGYDNTPLRHEAESGNPLPLSPVCERLSWTESCDKENTPPCAEETQETIAKEQNNNVILSSASEKHTPLQQQAGTDNVLTSNCAKCVKRRSSELTYEPSEESSDAGPGALPPAKRARNENVETSSPTVLSSSPNRSQSSYINVTSTTEPICQQQSTQTCSESMQTDTVQITSLVQRFNSGLTGLLSQAAAQAAAADSSCNIQGHCAEPSFVSCCTQVKDTMDTRSRPCIALTV